MNNFFQPQIIHSNTTEVYSTRKNNSIISLKVEKTVFSTFKALVIAFFVLALSLMGRLTLHSQPTYVWGKQLGGGAATNILSDEFGNVVISGMVGSDMFGNHIGGDDIFIAKYDSLGNSIWQDQFGTNSTDWANGGMARDNHGNFYITGRTNGSINGISFGGQDVFLIKYDENGKRLGQTIFGTPANDQARSICVDDSCNVYIVGNTEGNLGGVNSGSADCYIAKFDSALSEVFTIQFGSGSGDFCYGIAFNKENDITVCGFTTGILGEQSYGDSDVFFARYTKQGERVWIKQMGTDGRELAGKVLVDTTGNIYIAGSTSSNFAADNKGGSDVFIMKLNSKRETVWGKQFGSSEIENLWAMKFVPGSDKILLSGYKDRPNLHNFFCMYDFNGNKLWSQYLSSADPTNGADNRDICINSKGDIYLALFPWGSNFFAVNSNGGAEVCFAKFKLNSYSRGPLELKNPIQDIYEYDSIYTIPDNHIETKIENDTLEYIAMVAGTDKADNEKGIFSSTLLFDGSPDIDSTYNEATLLDTVLKKNKPLPNWLSFNSETLKLTGKPNKEEELEIVLIVKNRTNHIIIDQFKLTDKKEVTDIKKAMTDQVLVFPNPAKDFIQVKVGSLLKAINYRILDLNGRIIRQGRLDAGTIDINGINKGVYLLMLQTNGTMISKKVVVL